ncbi:hypothetical protein HKX48_000446 [Thoreauomyces humboldtii]|nr:hypothetical protein HKX48_000446 [Thoreauomyces humboldtii]
MTEMDERLLRAISQVQHESHLEPGDRIHFDSDPDSDDNHAASSCADSDCGSDHDDKDGREVEDEERDRRNPPPPPANTAAERARSDAALRQHLEIGGAKTGPKGVIADKKFHDAQERARNDIEARRIYGDLDARALSSGWAARQVAAAAGSGFSGGLAAAAAHEEENDNDDDEDARYLARYRAQRIAQLAAMASSRPSLPSYGRVFDLPSSDAYLSAIDDPRLHPSTTVVVHLYQPSNQACRIVNGLLDVIASTSRRTVKFCRIESHIADETFDRIALPALIAYREGDTVGTVMRVLDEVDRWTRHGRCEPQDLEAVMIEQGILPGDSGE